MTALGARQRTGNRRSRWLTIALFLLPALALYVVFVLFPIVQAGHFSLYKWNGLTPLTDFIGLENYETRAGDPVFRTAIVQQRPGHRACRWRSRSRSRSALAVMLNRRFPGRAAVPAAVLRCRTSCRRRSPAIVFRLLLQPDALVDSALRAVGLGAFVQDWLADPNARDVHAVRRSSRGSTSGST